MRPPYSAPPKRSCMRTSQVHPESHHTRPPAPTQVIEPATLQSWDSTQRAQKPPPTRPSSPGQLVFFQLPSQTRSPAAGQSSGIGALTALGALPSLTLLLDLIPAYAPHDSKQYEVEPVAFAGARRKTTIVEPGSPSRHPHPSGLFLPDSFNLPWMPDSPPYAGEEIGFCLS